MEQKPKLLTEANAIQQNLNVGDDGAGAEDDNQRVELAIQQGNGAGLTLAGYDMREVELLRREGDLMARELQLARCEMELLRNVNANASPQDVIQQSSSHVNINALKDLMSDFEGNDADFNKWKEQFELVRTTYKLDDNHERLLISAKLKEINKSQHKFAFHFSGRFTKGFSFGRQNKSRCSLESQDESDDGRRDADKIPDLPHELNA